MQQNPLFAEGFASSPSPRALPVLGEQKDIRYYGTTARSILNGPETTGMGFWSINPYTGCAFGCAYCYARYAHRYVMERLAGAEAAGMADDGAADDAAALPPWLAFERRILVKRNGAELLRRTLLRGGERLAPFLGGREAVVVGTATDPYQPAERRFRITRGILEVLAGHAGLSVVIITKSPLITRDVDVLSRLAQRSRLTVHLSLITLDRELARRIEPRAPTPEARLRALARLREAGIDTGINVMPVLPGITDNPGALSELVRRVAAAGATHVNACALRLQSEARRRYLPFIEQEFPHLAARYRASYAHGSKVGETYRAGLRAFFARECARWGLRGWLPDDGEPGTGTEEAEGAEGPVSADDPADGVRDAVRAAAARQLLLPL